MNRQLANAINYESQWLGCGYSALVMKELERDADIFANALVNLVENMWPYSAFTQEDWDGYRFNAVIRELTQVPTEPCWKCGGEQEVVSYYSGRGFAGGRIYHTTLACGHVNADESSDVAAAR